MINLFLYLGLGVSEYIKQFTFLRGVSALEKALRNWLVLGFGSKGNAINAKKPSTFQVWEKTQLLRIKNSVIPYVYFTETNM